MANGAMKTCAHAFVRSSDKLLFADNALNNTVVML